MVPSHILTYAEEPTPANSGTKHLKFSVVEIPVPKTFVSCGDKSGWRSTLHDTLPWPGLTGLVV